MSNQLVADLAGLDLGGEERSSPGFVSQAPFLSLSTVSSPGCTQEDSLPSPITSVSSVNSSEQRIKFAPLRFHPHFTMEAADDPADDNLLRTEDGVYFHFSRSILVDKSSFFQGLLSLPQPDTPDIVAPPLEIPSPSGDAMALILSIMDHGRPCSTKADAANLEVIRQAVPLAELLDAPLRPDFLKVWFHSTGFFPIALRIVLGEEPSSIELCQAVFTPGSPGIPHDQLAVLRKANPGYTGRMEAFVDRVKPVYEEFWYELHFRAPMSRGFNRFGMKCRQEECSSMEKYDGDFLALRKAAAKAIMAYFWSKRRALSDRRALRLLLASSVSCMGCQTRIMYTFKEYFMSDPDVLDGEDLNMYG